MKRIKVYPTAKGSKVHPIVPSIAQSNEEGTPKIVVMERPEHGQFETKGI
jgi:hypothetical protein